MRRLLVDRRITPVSITVLGGIFVTVIRLFVAAKGDVSRFIVVGSKYSSPHATPPFLHIFANSGYDGQFYWRLAAQPWRTALTPFHGIVLEAPYRLNRPGYPFLAWLCAGGRISLLSWSLLVVNLVGLVALVALGQQVCRERSISPWWALTLIAVPGLVGAWSRDLSEIVVAVCVVAGLAAWAHSREWMTAIAWSFAALTHESVLPVLAAVLLFLWWDEKTRRRSLFLIASTICLAVLTWQGWIAIHHGGWPLVHGGKGNLGVPFVGLASSMPHWFRGTNWHRHVEATVIVLQLFSFFTLLAVTFRANCREQRAAYVALAISAFLVICETTSGWFWPFDLRYGSLAMVLAWWILLHSEARWRRWGLVVVPIAFLTLALRCVVI